VQAELRGLRAELEAKSEFRDRQIHQIGNRVRALEKHREGQKLWAWIEPAKEHAWKLILGLILVLAMRLWTGKWPNIGPLLEKFGVG